MSTAFFIYDKPTSKSDYIKIVDREHCRRLVMLYVPELERYCSTTWVARHLMTVQAWYDKYILEIDCIKDRPKCKNCGSPVAFYSVIEGYKQYCSPKCAASNDAALQANRERNLKYWKEHPETRKQIGQTLRAWHATHQISAETRQKLSNSIRLLNKLHPERRKQAYANTIANMTDEQLLAFCRTRWSAGGRGIRNKLYIDTLKFCIVSKSNVIDNAYVEVKSNFEKDFVMLFEQCSIMWAYEPCVINIAGKTTCYLPDFMLQYNGNTYIVECKMWKFLEDDRTKVRLSAMHDYCMQHGYIDLLLTENDMTKEVLLSKLNCQQH